MLYDFTIELVGFGRGDFDEATMPATSAKRSMHDTLDGERSIEASVTPPHVRNDPKDGILASSRRRAVIGAFNAQRQIADLPPAHSRSPLRIAAIFFPTCALFSVTHPKARSIRD